ncbi:MAG: LysR family transcriptional regulator [Phreatobacter sp.]|uniref:LysR family transcriptional regulator n=1 Tax=Phreatobacter sp. TaxID=1966341 RepID=UPI001A377FA2|nr:LysR family transcriptional regulator [Phreatobacter sp.]MBL8570540.1 LysR family transcriptional regulator [Phreatobacter sp.]
MAGDIPDLGTMRLALTLADAGDLSVAGKAAGVGRRTAAARIAQLERQTGAVLFDHSGKRVRLTAAGEAFIGEARLALAALDRAERLAREVAEPSDIIGIGAIPDALVSVCRDLLDDPVWRDEGFAVRLHPLSREDQTQALAEGRIALGFVAAPLPVLPRLSSRLVATSKWSAVVPDAEARLRKTASLSNLARKPLVMLDRVAAPLAVDGVIAALGATGARPAIAQEAPDWTGVMALVALGLGSALVPSAVAKRVAVQGATVMPLVEAEDLPPWTISAIWLPQPTGARAARAIQIVRARPD